LRHFISSAINVIVQVARLSDGSRKLISLQEVTGMEGEVLTLQEIFAFEQTGVDADGKVKGRFKATGIRPRFAERAAAMGIHLPPDLFDASNVQEI
jgi:pilus assembly protein CpaF